MANEKGKGLGIAGFVFSLLGLLLFFIPFLGLILGVIGLILSIMQMRKEKTGLAISGLVLGIIGLIIGIFYLIAVILVFTIASGFGAGFG